MRELARNLVVAMGKADRSEPSRVTVPPHAPPASTTPAPSSSGGRIAPDGLGRLLTAAHVRGILGIDRSTVYRMAEDGRLPAVKIGRQWRFPAEPIEALVTHGRQTYDGSNPPVPGSAADPAEAARGPGGPDLELAQPLLEVTAYLLGVMMLVADMQGRPLTEVANPCVWFAEHSDDPEVMEACSAKWHAMAEDPELRPRFRVGALGVECAHAFIRDGNHLVGMVLAGGVAPDSSAGVGLYRLDDDQRRRVLDTLPRVAASLSRARPWPGSGSDSVRRGS